MGEYNGFPSVIGINSYVTPQYLATNFLGDRDRDYQSIEAHRYDMDMRLLLGGIHAVIDSPVEFAIQLDPPQYSNANTCFDFNSQQPAWVELEPSQNYLEFRIRHRFGDINPVTTKPMDGSSVRVNTICSKYIYKQ